MVEEKSPVTSDGLVAALGASAIIERAGRRGSAGTPSASEMRAIGRCVRPAGSRDRVERRAGVCWRWEGSGRGRGEDGRWQLQRRGGGSCSEGAAEVEVEV